MNKQIRLLAEQAGLRFTQLMSNPMVPVVDGKETDLEKFAELIVKECTDLHTHDDVMAPVGQSAYGEAYQDGWIEGTKAYRETILEHFGVEE